MHAFHTAWLGVSFGNKDVLCSKYIEGVMVAAAHAQPDQKGVEFFNTLKNSTGCILPGFPDMVVSCKVFLIASERRLQ